MIILLIEIFVAYLLGSIPVGYLLVRFVRKEDIREKGSGNIGATNVLRSGSKKLGAATFVLDAAKGYLAVMAGFFILGFGLKITGLVLSDGIESTLAHSAGALAALFAVVGHMFPIWLGFKGGKGVATSLGVFLALIPLTAVTALGVFAAVFLLSGYVSLASIIATASFPVVGLLLNHIGEPRLTFAIVCFIAALILIKHRQNIRRLIAGTEYRFRKPRPA
jgi:acyl phosphate:glycerol-3-phosphate acyltransferase